MLLLVTVALVFAGLILLIVGFVQDSLSLIYLSIACAAVAGIALIVFSRLSRRRAVRLALEGVPAAAAPPSPLLNRPRMVDDAQDLRARPAGRPPAPAYGQPEESAPRPATARAAFPGEFVDEDELTEPTASQPPIPPAPIPQREPQPQFASGASATAGHWEEEADWEEDWGDEVVFPIEDYDDLRVTEILPLLPQLEPDELEDVRDRESNTKARATIIARIDELLGGGPPTPAPAPAPARMPAAAPAGRRAAAGTTRATAGGRAAGAAAKSAAGTGKPAASAGRSSAAPSRSASSNNSATTRSAGASGRAGGKAAAGTRSGAARKSSGTAGRASGTTGKAAAAGKSAAGKAAPVPARPAAGSKSTTTKSAAAKSVVAKSTAAKKSAQPTKATANKATANKATEPAKRVAKKAGGDSTAQPRKR